MPKIALVHDWFTVYTGSERVVEQILNLYPDADLFSLVDFLPKEQRGFIQDKPVKTSFIQHLPLARQKFRYYLSLMPLAIEQFDLSSYDLVITSNHAVAKGVLTGPGQLHLSYIHSPIRYAWDMQHAYLQENGLEHGIVSWITRIILHNIRLWDLRTINGVDAIATNSRFIARRIWKVYRREASVIYPPVDIQNFKLCGTKEDFYLTVSRLVPYKKTRLIVEAFRLMPNRKLVVIGEGPDLAYIRKIAPKNVQVLGYQPSEILVKMMQRARAFLYAALEDFGIVLLEAQACGTPVIAYGKGAAVETIHGLSSEEPTGVFFYEQSVNAIIHAVTEFEVNHLRFTPHACRENANRFTVDLFRYNFSRFVEDAWNNFCHLQEKEGNK
ncbi:MAG: glycosyl transferase family 1 [Chloroflexi bacterium RBG_19FT_COMBO_49_13]|nr:MAG: glycosyl transferase family 1 [Chloroflexi bacterium RBG_19FT_COMBO_49_13]